MRLIESLYQLIIEAAPEEIYKKFYSDIERPMFVRIISLDPASKIEGKDEIKKIGKYSKLLLKMFKSGNLKPEDFPKAKDYLTLVYKHNVPVDLKSVKSLGDLFTLVEKYYSREGTKNVFDLVNILDDNEYTVHLSGEKWIVYTPKSEKAASYLGTGTEWCTSWGPYSTNDDFKSRKNHFTHHNGRGPLYIIINRNDLSEKYQFHFETKQFMDKNDRSINTGDFFDGHPEVTKFFYPSLYDDTPVDKDEIEKLGFLGVDLTSKLIERVIGESDNPLVNLLVNGDGDEMTEGLLKYCEGDEYLRDITFDFRNRTLEFTIEDLMEDSDLQHLQEVTRYYQYDADPYADHGEQLRTEITDNGDTDWENERLEEVLKLYFEQNEPVWTNNYETFKQRIFDHRDDLLNDYADEYAQMNEAGVTAAAETELNNIEKFISVSEESVTIPPSQLALFIHKENLTELNDLASLFSAYSNFHGLDVEYESPIWNLNHDYPTLREMTTHIETYSDKVEEELDQTPECVEKRSELTKVRNEYFKSRGGSYFSKDDLNILIKGAYDCEKGVPVRVEYIEKTTTDNTEPKDYGDWKRFDGYLTIEKIVEYINNERLLEFNNPPKV